METVTYLVLKINNSCFESCVYIQFVDGFPNIYFKATELAIFLEFDRPLFAICYLLRPELKFKWKDLSMHEDEELKLKFHPDVVFVNVNGVMKLISCSKYIAAEAFRQSINAAIINILKSLVQNLNIKIKEISNSTNLKLLTHQNYCKNGHIFVATTPIYREINLYIIGFTHNPEIKLLALNVYRLDGDKFEYIQLWKEDNAELIKNHIINKLEKTRKRENNFFYFGCDLEAKDVIEKILF